jgi:hypothetical protein
MHQIDSDDGIDPPTKKTQAPWDSNGDGVLQKSEADNWYFNGNGQSITVDNSKIDWKGLTMPLTGNSSFAISTIDAAVVRNQLYHYRARPNNSWGNFGRNVLNWIGTPPSYNHFVNGSHTFNAVAPVAKPYMINYINTTIRFK